MVGRPHLIDRLQKGKNKRLVLITGPAGSGKTSLVCQWIDQYKLPAVWYSLGDSDNEVDLFFRYLLTSLQQLDPRLESAFGPYLQGKKAFSARDAVGVVIHHLADLSKDVYVVLDDYHLIQSDEIHDAVSLIVQNAPPQMHIVLLARRDPPFSLSRLRSWNQIVKIGAPELKFSRKEAHVFIHDVLKMTFSDEQFETLYDWTEGWAAGLQLTGLSIQERTKVSGLKMVPFGSDWDTADYLITEVFAVQPENIRNFILKTAILERFNVALCREMTGTANTDEFLQQLDRNNLFLIPLDDTHQWYRYHHLFADALRLYMDRVEPAAIQPLHRKAALWFAEQNLLEEAFYHAFATKDIDFSANILEDHLMSLLVSYELVSFRRWVNRLPPWLVRQRYLLMVYEGFEALQKGYVKKAKKILTELENRKSESILPYSNKKRKYIEEQLLLLRHAISITIDPVNQDIGKLYRDLRLISSENIVTRAELESWIAWVNFHQGDVTKVFELVGSQFENLDVVKSSFGMSYMQSLRSKAERLQGHLQQSEAILKEGLNWANAERVPVSFFRMHYHSGMGMICYHRNELNAAMEHISTALKYTATPDLMDYQFDGYLNRAFVLQAMDRQLEAVQCMEKVQHHASRSQNSYYFSCARRDAALIYLMQGDQKSAVQWEQKRYLNADEPFSEKYENDCLVLANLWLHQEKYESIAKLLEHLRPRSFKRQRMEPVLHIDILYSAALYALGERKKAISILERSVAFAGDEGYIQLFLNYAPFIGEILMDLKLSAEPKVQSHVKSLINACGLEKKNKLRAGQVAINATEYLTAREVDILILIATGDTNNEIAEKMFVSIGTVKTHINNIFKKLNVKTRTQAILQANRLKITSDA
ncbi:MAG: hypothetical protein JRH15_20080 [Deltaproteobacteria bacterium]|nr:hypothetical protein [Deltaproteobacteria bacterium]